MIDMSGDQIKVPKKFEHPRDAAEALIKTFMQGTPVTAALAEFFGYHSESEFEKALDSWREGISEKVAAHDAVLFPSENITGLPAEIAQHLTKISEKGLRDLVMVDDLALVFPDINRKELFDALYHLERLGLVSVSRTQTHFSVEYSLFHQIDRQLMNFDTKTDAVELAKLMLENHGDAQMLQELSGWPLRRFNPPFAMLEPLFPDGRIRKTIQSDYSVAGYLVHGPDEEALRKFIEINGG
jgi:hypothetical protein